MGVSDVAGLLRDPRYLLHKIDLEGDRLIFLPTTHRQLEQASFLDGRDQIADGPAIACAIEAALAAGWVPPPPPDRFIFHVAFCGSTLLSRILDRPRRAMVLREPNILVDLADWKAALDRAGRSDPRLAPLAALACASLRARWRPDEPVVVKPSSWVNNLLPILCGRDRGVRPLFVVSRRRAFLRAVFRGGRERLAFAARAAAHLASGHNGHQALLAAAVSASSDPLCQVAHIAAFAHWLECQAFERALATGGWDRQRVVTLEAIERKPLAAASAAALALDLHLSAGELAEAIAANGSRNAKQPVAPYSAEEHQAADRAVEHLHGSRIERALAWVEDFLPHAGESETELEEHAERLAG